VIKLLKVIFTWHVYLICVRHVCCKTTNNLPTATDKFYINFIQLFSWWQMEVDRTYSSIPTLAIPIIPRINSSSFRKLHLNPDHVLQIEFWLTQSFIICEWDQQDIIILWISHSSQSISNIQVGLNIRLMPSLYSIYTSSEFLAFQTSLDCIIWYYWIYFLLTSPS